MRFLVTEKLGPHKFKTPEGYLICTDAILSRTGKQEYKRCELFGDACEDPDKIVNVERTDDEVFSDKAMASFENKAVCIEHPDHDVNAENHNELAVGFVRDIHKGEDNGKPVMMGTLVITDKDAVEAVESGEYKELSCGYDCDIDDDGEPRQRNIRGNHVALCKQGRAGIARIVDSIKTTDDNGVKWLIALDRHNIRFSFINGGYGMKFSSDADYNLAKKLAIQYGVKKGHWYDDKLEYFDFSSTMISNNAIYDAPVGRQITTQNRKILMFRNTDKFNDLKNEVNKLQNKGLSLSERSMIENRVRRIVQELKEDYNADMSDVKNNRVDATEQAVKTHYRKANPYIIQSGLNISKICDEDDGVKGMRDIQATKTPGTDKIIYVMQSDIDKNLYFYIGKTFSMKEGNWGYTKFEMGNTTPDELKSELARNGWHQVANGPARIIDASNEEWTVVEEENYKKANKAVIDEEYVQLPRGRFKVVEKTKEELEREGYGYHHSANGYSVYVKNNTAVAIKDAVKDAKTEYVFNWHDTYHGTKDKTRVDANSIKEAIKKFGDLIALGGIGTANCYVISISPNDGYLRTYGKLSDLLRTFYDSVKSATQDNKEQHFTIEYEQDGVMYIRKVRANSIEDAISKVKDDKIAELRAQLKTMQQLFERAPMGFKRAEYKKEIDRLKLELKKLGYNE